MLHHQMKKHSVPIKTVTMDINKALNALYDFYDAFTANLPVACGPGCVTCCSVNVSVTGLEGKFLLQHPALADTSVRAAITAAQKRPHFIPTFTTNELASACLNKQQPPEEKGLHAPGQCPLLSKDGLCQVYTHRPFSCRAMLSTNRCVQDGKAVMAPFMYTVNLAMYQMIEHLDREGTSANMLDILVDEKRNTIPNSMLSGFLVPPEEETRFQRIKIAVKKYPADTGHLEEFFPENIFL